MTPTYPPWWFFSIISLLLYVLSDTVEIRRKLDLLPSGELPWVLSIIALLFLAFSIIRLLGEVGIIHLYF